MRFELSEAVAVLSNTPFVLKAVLGRLPAAWTSDTAGGSSWSPFEVVGHLIHGERTDWMVRARQILEHGESRTFEPFDRAAHLAASRDRSLADLIEEFTALREENLATLEELQLGDAELGRTGRHPDFGVVTLRQLLAAWVVHDLNHIGQIARVMAGGYADEVGPWKAYLGILAP